MSDLIRRQDAIDALGEEPYIWNDTEEEWAYRNAWVEHISAIKSLPSAEPCDKDAISREGLLRSWEELSPRGRTEFDQVIMTVPALPHTSHDLSDYCDRLWKLAYERGRAEAEPKTGECRTCARNADNGGYYEPEHRTKCPIQEHYALLLDGFCHLYEPWSGARMRGEEDYELATEQMEYDAIYEPTYNSEDGSM